MRKLTLATLTLIALIVAFSAYGETNKKLYLNGNGYVHIPNTPDINLGTHDKRTIEVWFKVSNKNISTKKQVIYEEGGTVRGLDIYVFNGLLYVGGYNHPSEESNWSGTYLSTNTIESDKWHHVALVLDGTDAVQPNTLKAYLDGNQFGSGDGSQLWQHPGHIGIGAVKNGTVFHDGGYGRNGHYLKGLIDEVCIWNIARTQEQIQATINTVMNGDEEGLVAYWNFDDGTANDLTVNQNDGILYGDARIVNNQFYVSPSGNDTNDGSKESPFRTIQHAIEVSGRDDIITVLSGTYEENITFVSNLGVYGSGADTTFITSSSGNVITADNVYDVTVAGFTIDGQSAADNGILCSGSTSELEIRNNTVKNATRGIYCTNSAEVSIRNNVIRQNAKDGVQCSDSVNVTIDYNNLEDNERYGVACNGEAKVSIMNNDVRWNHGHGFSCWNTANVIIQYNVIRENNGWGALCTDSSTVTFISNTIQYNQHGIWCAGNAVVNITDNLIYGNQHRGIIVEDSSNVTIIRNIIRGHHGAIDCHDTVSPIIGGSLVNANNLANNKGRGIWSVSSNTINATYNYWGTDDESEIADKMINEGEGSIIFKPFIGDPELIGNVSGSGGITAYDASLILQYCVGLIDHLPANIPSISENITPRNRTISIPNVSVKTNELISVPIIIDETDDLVGGGITIKYDTAILRATGVKVTPDSLLNDTYWKSKVNNNEIRFAFSKDYSEETNNSKTVAMLEFEPVSNVEAMTTDLIIDHAQIAESLSIAKVDGHITFLPSKTALLQNYPNPFNPETWIPFKLSDGANVVISIYDVQGQLVRKIGLGKISAGVYVSKDKAVYWDGCNNAGEKVSSGIYFYTLQAEDYSATRRMLILK